MRLNKFWEQDFYNNKQYPLMGDGREWIFVLAMALKYIKGINQCLFIEHQFIPRIKK